MTHPTESAKLNIMMKVCSKPLDFSTQVSVYHAPRGKIKLDIGGTQLPRILSRRVTHRSYEAHQISYNWQSSALARFPCCKRFPPAVSGYISSVLFHGCKGSLDAARPIMLEAIDLPDGISDCALLTGAELGGAICARVESM